jgi:DNA-binding CsgD family transcriptional regulator/PAS domain-containing protein
MRPGPDVLSKLLGVLYEAATEPSLWNEFLRQLGEFIGAESAGLLWQEAGVHTISHSWEMDPELARLHNEYYYSVDPWSKRGGTSPAGTVGTSQSLCPLAELKTTEIYNDLMIRFRIEHGLFTVLEPNIGPRGSALSLYRSSSSPAFGAAEEEILRLFAGHLRQAFKLYRQFSDLRAWKEGFENALEAMPTGIIFFGTDGKVAFMNRLASALLSQRDGLLSTPTGLRAERPTESAMLETTIRQAASTSNCRGFSPGATVLVSRRSRPPLQVIVSPVGNSAIRSRAVSAIAYITDPTQRPRPSQDVLRSCFRLTPAECRVALLLYDGRTPKQVAELLGVSINTVRSQIKAVLSKVDVRRQAELVRVFSSRIPNSYISQKESS